MENLKLSKRLPMIIEELKSAEQIFGGFFLANLFPETLDTIDEMFSEVNDMSLDSFLNVYFRS